MVNGALAVGLNIVLNLALIKPMAHSGLALATSISATFTTMLLFLDLRKKIGPIGLRRYLICFSKTLFASIIMGALVYGLFFGLTPMLPDKWIIELLALLLSVGIGAFVYFILCCILRVKEMRILMRTLVRRVRR